MKKVMLCILSTLLFTILVGFTSSFSSDDEEKINFDINNLYDYQKQFKAEEIEICAKSGAKTYMDYRMTTVVNSTQYQFIHNNLTIDPNTGFLYDKDGFIAVALGSFYGHIGDRYYFTLDTGVVLPLVKAEEKADQDTDSRGCYHLIDSSIIEFVIDSDYAGEYFGDQGNGLVLNGNYNNYSLFKGDIEKVEKVLDEKAEKVINFSIDSHVSENTDIFNYASGY